MTFENKIVVGLDDIKAITFECNQCRARLSLSPDSVHIPRRCHNCENVWIVGNPTEVTSTSSLVNFVDSISRIRKQLESGAPFRILLEYENKTAK